MAPPRKHAHFVCKKCGAVVYLKSGERPRAYCSSDCLASGRSAAIKRALGDPEVKARLRAGVIASWAENKRARLAYLMDPAVVQRRAVAIRAAMRAPDVLRERFTRATARMTDPVERAKWLSAIHSPEARARMKASISTAKRSPKKGNPYHARSGIVHFRSRWELVFASVLDHCGLQWTYEPRTFILRDGAQYTPDFFVETPFGSCFVELHRVEQPKPGDERKIKKLLVAVTEIPQQTGGAPLHVIGESGMREIIKAAKAIVREE